MKTTVAEAHAFHVIPPDQMAKISADVVCGNARLGRQTLCFKVRQKGLKRPQ